ncbi:hypothetical protein PACTADRAFT_50865 [Pachysolen tannophilus NRRL Y-2460]|uniref:Vacuolar sorting protein Vps3844 C-terminal domain-containing protein n=1 Tax=Pachysolen tannophilus NRRL Y-2460 TaxID=669874 RepID=A0A1E4TTF8_PACTA|nr:hypothetical protein PACTADRAFT_50865 [Pachysolen tannophilus NRRL Y-2460]
MNLLSLISLVTFLSSLVECVNVNSNNIAVFSFPIKENKSSAVGDVPILKDDQAILKLADKFGISDNYNLNYDSLDNLALILGQDEIEENVDKIDRTKVILIVNGIDDPSNFFSKEKDKIEPFFEIKKIDKKNHKDRHDFVKFLQEIPSDYENLYDLTPNMLSNQFKILQIEDNSFLKKNWFNYFGIKNLNSNDKLRSIWESLKDSFHLENSDSSLAKRSIDRITDESFINELSQLNFLLDNVHNNYNQQDIVIVNLKSITSIFKKTGLNSNTYDMSKRILSNLINKSLNKNFNKFDSTIIVLPIDQELTDFKEYHKINEKIKHSSHLKKRSLSSSSSSSSSSDACFLSEESCLLSTSSCSNHGVCSKVGNCYSCVCSASYNKTTKSTTYWQGFNCSKKDVSVEFNLFLWFTIFMTIALVAGIKLMFSIGNEELPGVLTAATIAKKSNV